MITEIDSIVIKYHIKKGYETGVDKAAYSRCAE